MVFIILTCVSYCWRVIHRNTANDFIEFFIRINKSSYPSLYIECRRIIFRFITITNILFYNKKLRQVCRNINWIF